jgi:hypothetical protein
MMREHQAGLNPAERRASIERTIEARRIRGEVPRRFGKSGRLTMQVDARSYYATIREHGGVRPDGKTIWDDPDYQAFRRRTMPGESITDDIVIPAGLRNRFGRVKERIVMRVGRDGKVERQVMRREGATA